MKKIICWIAALLIGGSSFAAYGQEVNVALQQKLNSQFALTQVTKTTGELGTTGTGVVLQKVNLDALGLNDEQKLVIAQLQQQFIDNVGGPYQDPNDPAYLERWEKAQPESDNMLKGMLGTSIFENYQMAASNPQNGNQTAAK